MISNILFFALIYKFIWKPKRTRDAAKGIGAFANPLTIPDPASTVFAYGSFVLGTAASVFVPVGMSYFLPAALKIALPCVVLGLFGFVFVKSVKIPYVDYPGRDFVESLLARFNGGAAPVSGGLAATAAEDTRNEMTWH